MPGPTAEDCARLCARLRARLCPRLCRAGADSRVCSAAVALSQSCVRLVVGPGLVSPLGCFATWA